MEVLIAVGVWLTQNVALLLQIVGAFAVLATMTPNKTDDKIVQVVLDLVNFLGANTGKAKNPPGPDSPPPVAPVA